MKKNTDYALVIDYEFCTGCHTCEIACQKEHGYDPDTFGIVLRKLGPWEHSPKQWQLDNIPVPTDLCDHCAERVDKGKQPTCVQHCQSGCMYFGSLDEMARKVDSTHEVLFTVG